jgi:glycogen operon protein
MGANFAVYAGEADAVEVCLFDAGGGETRLELPEMHGHVWHGYLPFIEPGQLYGYRAHGPYDPSRGLLYNPNKLLLDPYSRAITGDVVGGRALLAYDVDDRSCPSPLDSAPSMPRSVLVNPYFDWGNDHRPSVHINDSVIYEVHVKGATKLHPEIPEELRGTYLGLAHPAFIDHLQKLGITAVELLPVHQHVDEPFLVKRGLTNYWGYNTIAFFAPHQGYVAGHTTTSAVQEFRTMVKALHEAGIEVILDVVYNHTAEGNHLGPTLCFKGLDNRFYRWVPHQPGVFLDFTGTGNSFNMDHPFVLQLIMDSLRYWVTEMHVDGFRFDLAVTLAREHYRPDRLSAFFDLIQQDPVLDRVTLIAEPWDVGMGGYQVGNFPPGWSEWNGKYRDCVRDYWRASSGELPELATRLAGSSDLYSLEGRTPYASINFITAHDGFTLRDLVSYDEKHNEANKEANRDGADDNRSWNCGVEGPTDDPVVDALRSRQQRNFLTTLLLSQGTPMLLGGDEFGRTQQGNNNAYCQDSEISWFDWSAVDHDLLEFTTKLIALSKEHPVLRRRRFLTGHSVDGNLPDLGWFRPDGHEMSPNDWSAGTLSIGAFFNGDAISERGANGEQVVDQSFYFCCNSYWEPVDFVLPAGFGEHWEVVVDTGGWTVATTSRFHAGDHVSVTSRSMVVLRRPSLTAPR